MGSGCWRLKENTAAISPIEGGLNMSSGRRVVMAFLCFGAAAFAAQDVAGVVEGTVSKVDGATKTIVIKTADGSEQALHFVKRTSVHGAKETAAVSKDAFHGLKEGSAVVAHYTANGSEKTAEEVDDVGKDGLKVTEGTVSRVDRGAKTIAVRTADGAEETYRLTDHAAKDAGKDIAHGAEKSERVTVYYTEEAGHKIAHFFKKTI
jgi:arginine repressor